VSIIIIIITGRVTRLPAESAHIQLQLTNRSQRLH